MRVLDIENPFGAPVYHEERVSSTMDVSRSLAERGEPHGTVILADFQESGRGRSRRQWTSEMGQNLMFTILLRYPMAQMPAALTLKAGLALSLSIEDFFPALASRIMIKWPNDIMIRGGLSGGGSAGKAAGILAETEGSVVFLGMGINLGQRSFPSEIKHKALSIVSALEELSPGESSTLTRCEDTPVLLLEKILLRFYEQLECPLAETWKTKLKERLYKTGEDVSFSEGAADSGKIVKGRLEGIGDDGELLLVLQGEKTPRRFFTGELMVY